MEMKRDWKALGAGRGQAELGTDPSAVPWFSRGFWPVTRAGYTEEQWQEIQDIVRELGCSMTLRGHRTKKRDDRAFSHCTIKGMSCKEAWVEAVAHADRQGIFATAAHVTLPSAGLDTGFRLAAGEGGVGGLPPPPEPASSSAAAVEAEEPTIVIEGERLDPVRDDGGESGADWGNADDDDEMLIELAQGVWRPAVPQPQQQSVLAVGGLPPAVPAPPPSAPAVRGLPAAVVARPPPSAPPPSAPAVGGLPPAVPEKFFAQAAAAGLPGDVAHMAEEALSEMPQAPGGAVELDLVVSFCSACVKRHWQLSRALIPNIAIMATGIKLGVAVRWCIVLGIDDGEEQETLRALSATKICWF